MLLEEPGPHLLGLASIYPHGGFRSEKLKTYGGESKDKHICKEGDVYASLKDVTQTADLLGAVARIPPGFIGRLSQDTVRLNPKSTDVDMNYIYWILRTPQYRNYCFRFATGVTTLGLQRKDFLDYTIPKRTEFRSIFHNILEDIEGFETNTRDISRNISTIISTLFRSWFIDFDPVKAKAEGKLPYGMDEETAALFSDSFEDSELGLIPTEWRISSISEICKMSSGGTPSRAKKEYFSGHGEGYPWLASRELNGNIIHDAEEYISELGLKKSSAKLSPENSVAMAMYGATAGRIGYFAKPLTTSQAICVMMAKDNICLPKYLYFLIGSESWKIVWMNALGGAQPNISQQSIGKHRIVLPPLAIIQKFESLVEDIFGWIDTSSIQSEKLIKIRDALLPRLMSGELKVN